MSKVIVLVAVKENVLCLSKGSGHGVDDVAEHLLEASQPVGDLSESSVSNGTLHVVTGAWGQRKQRSVFMTFG